MINQAINRLIKYGLSKNLLTVDDQEYVLKKLAHLLEVEDTFLSDVEEMPIEKILDDLVHHAKEKNLIREDSSLEMDHFKARMMDCLLPRPSDLNKMFRAKYKKSPQQASRFFHEFSLNSHYIESQALEDNLSFLYTSQFGDLEVIINKAKTNTTNGHKKFDPINKRQASISVNNEKNAWTMEFLPQPVLEEHCLISRKDFLKPYNNDKTFEELIDFVNKFPQYFVMSDMVNALSVRGKPPYHYFQAGKHVFPIESAEVIGKYKNSRVRIEILNWPVSAVRLIGNNENRLLDIMHDLYQNWIQYSNESLKIQGQTEENIHNIIDVMVKLDGSKFNVYMIFKNNYQSDRYPRGLFQTDEKSILNNFGMLEDLGVCEINQSLYDDLELVKKILLGETDISKHQKLKYLEEWITLLKDKEQAEDINLFLINQLGELFEKTLKETNVFKFGKKEDFIAFVEKAV
ncbi:MAG: hypothetical protein ACLFPM_00200 [Candidatus Izemoplasmatales bacterium]